MHVKSSDRAHMSWLTCSSISSVQILLFFSKKKRLEYFLQVAGCWVVCLVCQLCWIHLCNQNRWGHNFFGAVSASHIQMPFRKGFSGTTWHDPENNLACCTYWNVIYFMNLPDQGAVVLMPGKGKNHSQQYLTSYREHALLLICTCTSEKTTRSLGFTAPVQINSTVHELPPRAFRGKMNLPHTATQFMHLAVYRKRPVSRGCHCNITLWKYLQAALKVQLV